MAEMKAGRRGRCGLLSAAVLLLSAACVSAPPPEEGLLRLPAELAQPEWRAVAAGVDYAAIPATRFVPRLHLLRVDLENDAVEAAPYPPQERGAEPHWVAGQSAGNKGVAAMVSATPFRYRFSWRRGFLLDPVGVYKVEGELYSRQEKQWGVLWQDLQGRLHITDGLAQPEQARWAVGGYEPILIDGENIGIHGSRDARTAVGLGRKGRFLYLVVVEGDECGRRGLTSRETAALAARLGAYQAMNFDGGDSAFLLIAGDGGHRRYAYRGDRYTMACFFVVRSGSIR